VAEVGHRWFEVTAPAPGVLIDHSDIHLRQDMSLEVNIAEVLQRNALAIPYRGRLLMRLVGRELALVLSLFGRTPPGSALTRHDAYDSASLHVRRFASEVFALGGLTAVVGAKDASLSDVAHFDALPAALREQYPKSGVRPDLRFASSTRVLAGESRGRSRAMPVWHLTAPDQRRRLDELLEWSRRPGCDPVCMAWSWMQNHHTTIDFFTFIQDTATEPMEEAAVDVLERLASDGGSSLPRSPLPSERSDANPGRERERQVKREFIRKTISDREDQLLESAPSAPLIELNKAWYGEWEEVPTYDGSIPPRLLLASSRSDPDPPIDSSSPDLIEVSKDEGLEAYVEGRTMVAIDWQPRSSSASNGALERMLRRRL
jgi:hypothetical protein